MQWLDELKEKKNPICPFPLFPKLLDVGLEVYPYAPGEAEDGTQAAVQITLRLPANVIYFEVAVVARWDPAGMNLFYI